ncbi:MAG: methylated-DNA--[protein]-cysteine S-methyltransferase [Rhizobiales bacterium]|nr:methylated-DNA--[protein]-cysteine S-methyltransferase [Hyphomicrobiales bacterium]
MLLVTDGEGCLRAADWQDHEDRMHQLIRRYYGANGVRLEEAPDPTAAGRALLAYFDGDLGAIDALPIATSTTDFQAAVWSALRRIPAGKTMSYGALATRLGRPNAARAVGHANGSNPISIVVPCHRLIGANAALTGYGGGIERKRWLLAHESALGRAPALAAGVAPT